MAKKVNVEYDPNLTLVDKLKRVFGALYEARERIINAGLSDSFSIIIGNKFLTFRKKK